MNKKRSQWASNLGFILSAAGSAVGLGNIWKFPGKAAAYGGGAFILCYVVIVFLIGLPVMLTEMAIGRSTQKNVVGAFQKLNKKWTFLGGIGVLTLFVILSYYIIVGGWVLKYMWVYLSGGYFGTGASMYQDYFLNFITQPIEPLLWGLVFLIFTIFIVVRGVSEGIERVSKFLMPCLFLLLIGICIRSLTLPNAMEGLRYLFHIDWQKVDGNTIVGALGQAFFSLSVGMGIMITYSSYVPKKENLLKSSAYICAIDTLVALLSAIAIVPAVYVTLGADGLGVGGGFAFMALPSVFAQMPGGVAFGFVFFTLLFLAALTSAISILESCVAYISEEKHFSRLKSTLIITIPMLILSVGYSLSQLSSRGICLPWFDFANGFQMMDMNIVLEKFTDNLMIPIGALLFCIFTGWIWGSKNAIKEFQQEGVTFPLKKIWAFAIKYLAPIFILVILYFTIGKGQGLS